MSPNAAAAQRAAVAAALLGIVGTALSVAGYWRISGPSLRAVQSVGLLVSGTAFCVLLARQSRTSARLSNTLFMLVLVPTVVLVWMADDARAATGAHWVPYEPNKLSALTIAMIAPPSWSIGIIGILAFVGSAVAHHLVLPEAVRARMSASEPLAIIAYGVFALVLLGLRLRGRSLRGALEDARSERLALSRMAHVASSLRDLANTPLQTLELVRQALLIENPKLPTQARRMAHALERLRRLNDILGPYQDAVRLEKRQRTGGRGRGARPRGLGGPPLTARRPG